MTKAGTACVVLLGGLAMQGCSLAEDAPPRGDRAAPVTADERRPAPAAPTGPVAVPAPGRPAAAAPQARTPVGQKVVQLQAELERLRTALGRQETALRRVRAQTADKSGRYHNTIAAINARLQIGTTPGNPELVGRWNEARALLAAIDGHVAELNALAGNVADASTLSAYLLETARSTYGLTGAVDEDHRRLSLVEDEVNKAVVSVERLLNEISSDVARQTAYLAGERANLTTLSLAIKNGQILGASLARRPFLAPPAEDAAGAASDAAAPRRPLVVIRFDRPNVEYQQALYNAVKQALDQRPQASFDLVAVAPDSGSAAEAAVASNRAKRNAEAVLRSLTEMGMPADRVRLSAITSREADSNEVRLYVR